MKIALRYGLIYIGINIVWSLLMYVSGMSRSDYATALNTLAMLIPILCIVLAVREYKSSIGQGFMPFSMVFKHGLVIFLIGGLGISAYSLVYTGYIDPDFNDYMLNKELARMEVAGRSEKEIEIAISMSEKLKSPFIAFTVMLLGSILSGAIISLIMAALLKKPNPDGIFADTNRLV